MDANFGSVVWPISGENLYKIRARVAIPVLVRQARAKNAIVYSDLAEELGMPNPRNLDYVLGCVGNTMIKLGEYWSESVPPIQCLVVNKQTHLPGAGIDPFFQNDQNVQTWSVDLKKEMVDAALAHVYAYRHWDEVLKTLGLSAANADFTSIIGDATRLGGGETESHRRMKLFVAANPSAVGLPSATASGECEYMLPSGDRLDVSFRRNDCWIAVEVK
ncbi:MAG: hypothetical protein KJ755_02630, partial [Alphaproteobacteria bacterium]|nr:hypothetical protein [Alphaproteobacteria bacterium]